LEEKNKLEKTSLAVVWTRVVIGSVSTKKLKSSFIRLHAYVGSMLAQWPMTGFSMHACGMDWWGTIKLNHPPNSLKKQNTLFQFETSFSSADILCLTPGRRDPRGISSSS
jgi:hypothetical protein